MAMIKTRRVDDNSCRMAESAPGPSASDSQSLGRFAGGVINLRLNKAVPGGCACFESANKTGEYAAVLTDYLNKGSKLAGKWPGFESKRFENC